MKIAPTILIWRPRLRWRSRSSTRRSQARRTVLWFAITFISINAGLSLGMEHLWPALRDKAYTSKLDRVKARAAVMPQTVVLGSSRTDHGIKPDSLSMTNCSQVGAGPLLQLLTLKRLFADGVTPREVIIEYWPPFLHSEGQYSEWIRIDPHRYFLRDEEFLRDYHPNPAGIMSFLHEVRRTPVWNHRQWLLSQTLPSWLPGLRRLDGGWDRLDETGWRAGWQTVSQEQRERSLEIAKLHYGPLLASWKLEPKAERAMKEIVTRCKERGIPVTMVWMPESPRFRSWYPPEVLAASERLFQSFAGEVRLVYAREWMNEESFVDGYHLTAPAAAAFTSRLQAER